jgi:competence ComEA-like helix-hairpin-helix protein
MRVLILLAFLAAPLAAQVDLPEGKGKDTLENTCTECHGLDRALSQLRTTEKWRAIAVTMRSKGATMTDEELNTLVEYLSQNFGLPEPKVNVNAARAEEIQAVLELKPAEASAIVRHRKVKGPFKEWSDVAKVDGVDRAKIEAVKNRLLF